MNRDPRHRDRKPGNSASYGELVIALNKARRKENLPDLKYEDVFPSSTGVHDRAITAQSVQAHALETFGSPEKAGHWMNRPNPLFQGRTPLQVIQSDAA